MGWSRHHQVGLIHYEPSAAYRGYTLVATNGGYHANLIDMEGRVCHRWDCKEGVHYCYLLPNGNLFVCYQKSQQIHRPLSKNGSIIPVAYDHAWSRQSIWAGGQSSWLVAYSMVLQKEPLEAERAAAYCLFYLAISQVERDVYSA